MASARPPADGGYSGKDPYQDYRPPVEPEEEGGLSAADRALIAALTGAANNSGTNIRISGGGGGGGGANKKQQAKNLAAELMDRAKQLGLSLTESEIAKLAKTAVDEKWSEAVITDELLIGTDWNKVTGGDLTAGRDIVKGVGASYLVPLSDQQAQDYSLRIARGELTQQGVTSMLQDQARARWSWMAPLIDQGVKPSDYFAPIKTMIANTLEMAPDSIDLMDPKWIGMVEVTDQKSGGVRAATLNEAMLAARNRPEWSSTRQAQEYTAQVGMQLASIFGRN